MTKGTGQGQSVSNTTTARAPNEPTRRCTSPTKSTERERTSTTSISTHVTTRKKQDVPWHWCCSRHHHHSPDPPWNIGAAVRRFVFCRVSDRLCKESEGYRRVRAENGTNDDTRGKNYCYCDELFQRVRVAVRAECLSLCLLLRLCSRSGRTRYAHAHANDHTHHWLYKNCRGMGVVEAGVAIVWSRPWAVTMSASFVRGSESDNSSCKECSCATAGTGLERHTQTHCDQVVVGRFGSVNVFCNVYIYVCTVNALRRICWSGHARSPLHLPLSRYKNRRSCTGTASLSCPRREDGGFLGGACRAVETTVPYRQTDRHIQGKGVEAWNDEMNRVCEGSLYL